MAQPTETTRRPKSMQSDSLTPPDKAKLSRLQAHTGMLVTCDPALKQFLIKLNNDQQYKFIMRDLDASHLFIHSTKYPPPYKSVGEWLQAKVDEWNRKWTYIDDAARVDD